MEMIPGFHSEKKTHPPPLLNVGNSCYINSVLQLLIQCEPIMMELNEYHRTYPSSLIFAEFSSFWKRCAEYHHESPSVNPISILNIMRLKQQFVHNLQGDSHEFLMTLLHIFHDEMVHLSGNAKVSSILDHFYYEVRRSPSTVIQKELMFVVPVSRDLEISMEMFFEKGQTIVTTWPHYMLILIVRYNPNQKIEMAMNVPMDLYFENQKYHYEWKGSVIHHGASMSTGHYVAIIPWKKEGRFFRCDDDRIQEINQETVKLLLTSSYFVLYERQP